MKFAANRESLFNELHTRPFPLVEAPARLSHFALRCQGSHQQEWQQLKQLCEFFGIQAPLSDSYCFYQDFEGFYFRWERHTEFSTYLIIQSLPSEQNIPADDFFQSPALKLLPEKWIKQLPGEIISAQHLEIHPYQDTFQHRENLRNGFEGQRLIGSRVLGGLSEIWTAYRIHHDGFGRFLILNHSANPCQCGRLIRSLLEIETYRMSMLSSLPVAKSIGPKTREMDLQLAGIIEQINLIEGFDDERRLLTQLSDLAAHTEKLIAESIYRFSAAEAYHTLIEERLDELRESEMSGLTTLREFLTRRLGPAWRTCRSMQDYLEDLSTRINRANALIRARVDLSLESQNQALLQSMDRRSQLQLRLQQAVEGLSVMAITYYASGLVKYLALAAKDSGLDVNSHLVTGLAVPCIFGLVTWSLHRFKKKLNQN